MLPAFRWDRRLFWFSVIVFGTAIMSAVATIVVHTGEIQRYGMQETVATKIATVIMLACALDAWLVRRRGPTGEHYEEASSTLEPSRT